MIKFIKSLWDGNNKNMNNKNNTGIDNTGDWNSGDWNSGDWNSGNGNSGDWNSGYGNSGNGNSGNRNSGYGNSTDRESGIFNSEQGTIRIFNKDSGKKWDEIDHPHFYEFYLTKWISEDDMTEEEKKADPQFYVRKGYLKKFAYKEAWANFWKNTDEANRQKFLALPNFDAAVFKDITGIDVEVKKPSLKGKKVKVKLDGESYEAIIQ